MNTIIETKNRTETDLEHEVSQFSFRIISVTAILFGIWGAACMISGLLSNGVMEMARGYFTAITGM